MNLPIDWAFAPDHTELVESGAMATGEGTLADWACTVALTPIGDSLEDGSFGAEMASEIEQPNANGAAIGAKLRGYLLEDDRVEEVEANGVTLVGSVLLPVRITPSDGPYRFSGPLTAALIEEIIEDWELD